MATALLLLGRLIGLAAVSAAALVWLHWTVSALYMLLLAVLAAVRRRHLDAAPETEPLRRMCVLVPAHDEELLLGAVLDALRNTDYPEEMRSTVVIADNCSDGTADVARSHGAEVLERRDPDRRGKGYALEWALPLVLADKRAFDAVVVLDADSVLAPGFLAAMSHALGNGSWAVQGRYDVLNSNETWRTRLMACALALIHHVRPMGRMALGLSDSLKGNGMCFSRATLERVPWSGESVTEDIEYTLRLVAAGVRVVYSPAAIVRAQMPTDARQAGSQRRRWEGGRYRLLRRAAGALIQGVRTRDLRLADRAWEVFMPPLAELFVLPVAACGVCWVAHALGAGLASGITAALWAGTLAVATMYVVVGLMVARVPARIASALLFAPAYVAWKLMLYIGMAARRGATGWVRTERRTMDEQDR